MYNLSQLIFTAGQIKRKSEVQNKTVETKSISPGSSRVFKVNIPFPRYGEYILTLSRFCPRKVFFCAMGCRRKFGKYSPHDLVVITRTRYPPRGRGKISNFYYHLNEECLKKGNSDFRMDKIIIPNELRGVLTSDHISRLRSLNIDTN